MTGQRLAREWLLAGRIVRVQCAVGWSVVRMGRAPSERKVEKAQVGLRSLLQAAGGVVV